MTRNSNKAIHFLFWLCSPFLVTSCGEYDISGRPVAFIANHNLWVCQNDGGDKIRIADDVHGMIWAGERLCWVSSKDREDRGKDGDSKGNELCEEGERLFCWVSLENAWNSGSLRIGDRAERLGASYQLAYDASTDTVLFRDPRGGVKSCELGKEALADATASDDQFSQGEKSTSGKFSFSIADRKNEDEDPKKEGDEMIPVLVVRAGDDEKVVAKKVTSLLIK